MKKRAIAILLTTVGLVVIFASSTLNVIDVSGQGQQATALPILTVSPTPTLTLDQQAGDLLRTYEEVLDISKNTVEEVHKTFDFAVALVGVVIAILSIGGIGAAAQDAG